MRAERICELARRRPRIVDFEPGHASTAPSSGIQNGASVLRPILMLGARPCRPCDIPVE